MTVTDPFCDHDWFRDDATTKQCLRCGGYAPIRGGEGL